jgi:hypothetical protein
MIATNDTGCCARLRSVEADGPNSGATAHFDILLGDAAVKTWAWLNLAERNAQIWRDRMEQMRRLGAVVGHGVKWWPVRCTGLSGP